MSDEKVELTEAMARHVEARFYEVVAERDRLRAVVDAAHDFVMAFDTEPDHGDEVGALRVALLALLDVSPTMGAVEHTRLGHYLSTYCLHDVHERCRLVCKTCDAPCRCHCHGGDTDAETVGPSARVGETGLAGAGDDAGTGMAGMAGPPDIDPTSPTYDPDQYGTPAVGTDPLDFPMNEVVTEDDLEAYRPLREACPECQGWGWRITPDFGTPGGGL